MTTEPTADLIARFRRYEDAWNEGDFDTVDDLFAESVSIHDVPTGTTYDGRAAFKGWITDMREAFPDFETSYSERDIIVSEGTVAVEWTASGTHEGHLGALDLAPTNESVEISGVVVYELDDGMVTDARWYYDMLGILSQLGAAPEEIPA